VELPLHEMLPLGPTVVVQVELPVQSRLHDSAHEPSQLVWFAQASVQLPAPPPQIVGLKLQLVPELQAQVDPLQTAAGGEEPPQPQRKARTTNTPIDSSRIALQYDWNPPEIQSGALCTDVRSAWCPELLDPTGWSSSPAGTDGRQNVTHRSVQGFGVLVPETVFITVTPVPDGVKLTLPGPSVTLV
jgi:hypothetical protein